MINLMRQKNSIMEYGLLELINLLPNDIIMIEIGCFAGDSTEIFLNSDKINKFYAIDAWENNLDTYDIITIKYDLEEVEKCFDNRITNVYNNVIKIKSNSLNCSELFDDNSVDFIYLDSSHNYEQVKKEIELYYPKVKNNGFIGGHDYNNLYYDVTKAVDEFCKPDFLFQDSSWIKRKIKEN